MGKRQDAFDDGFVEVMSQFGVSTALSCALLEKSSEWPPRDLKGLGEEISAFGSRMFEGAKRRAAQGADALQDLATNPKTYTTLAGAGLGGALGHAYGPYGRKGLATGLGAATGALGGYTVGSGLEHMMDVGRQRLIQDRAQAEKDIAVNRQAIDQLIHHGLTTYGGGLGWGDDDHRAMVAQIAKLPPAGRKLALQRFQSAMATKGHDSSSQSWVWDLLRFDNIHRHRVSTLFDEGERAAKEYRK